MTLPIEVNPLLLSTLGGYTISRSVRLRSSASAYFNRTPANASNRKTWTWSAWVKRGKIGSDSVQYELFTGYSANSDAGYTTIYFYNDALRISGFSTVWRITSQVFRDPSAWYHIVIVLDTTQATASNRVKLYVNGVQVTAFGTSNDPSLNADLGINTAASHAIAADLYGGVANYFDGYLTEINFIDGQALTPSSFGQTNSITGVWQPIKYSGTYGTNGFYLNFSDNSSNTSTTIGKDYSGNGNNWTPNNISVTAGVTYDSMIDVPTVSASSSNYAVLNPLDKGTATVADGNLGMSRASGGYSLVRGSIAVPTTGKWYWEGTLTTSGGSGNDNIGVALATTSNSTYVGDTGSYSYQSNGIKYTSGTSSSYGVSFTSGDVIGVAFDADAGTVTFYKNNSSQGVAFSSLTSGPYFPAVSAWGSTWAFNFGQRPFSYTPPSGFNALNTFNLPTPTIANGAQNMNAITYTGNSGSQTVSNGVFQPDLTWHKTRSAVASHVLFDSIRGASSSLSSDLAVAQNNNWTGQSFTSTGFTVSNSYSSESNYNGQTMVAWQWKAGNSTSTNTNGSITSTVSVNATAGFSVVTYTGNGSTNQTVGHGLGVAPSMIIIKNRSSAIDWIVYHASIGATGFLYLNLTTATTTSSNPFNNTAPTSSVFTIAGNSSNSYVNGNGNSMLAYCFSAVAGYSAFGSYTGNGSSDGPFVYCGFRPRWILYKNSTAATVGNWVIHDTSRSTYNAAQAELSPDVSDAEPASSNAQLDILSNGFKLRGVSGNTSWNQNGVTYIYAAFAENPFKLALAR